MELAASMVKLSLRRYQDRVVRRASNLPGRHVSEANCTGRYQCILGDTKGELSLEVPTEAPLEASRLRYLLRQIVDRLARRLEPHRVTTFFSNGRVIRVCLSIVLHNVGSLSCTTHDSRLLD